MKPTRKHVAIGIVVIGGALLGERGVALLAPEAEVVAAVAAKRPRNRSASADNNAAAGPSAAQSVQLDRLDERRQALADDAAAAHDAAGSGALFEPQSWLPPAPKAPPPPPPAPPQKPVVPPFPYAYMGGLVEDGVRTAFFTKGNRVLPVKAGDTIDTVYRVEQMTDTQMQLTYLPLGEPLAVAIGSAR